MLNLMKWDLINVWKKTKGYIICVAVFILLTIIFPKDFIINFFPKYKVINVIYPMIASFTFIVFFISGIFYTVFKMVTEARKNTYALEITADRKPWELVLSKLIVNIILIVLLILSGYLFSFVMNKFSTENMEFFNFFSNQSYFQNILSITYSAITLYFAYVLSRSIRFTRNNPILWTIIIIILISLTFSLIDLGLTKLCGAEYQLSTTIEDEEFLGLSIDFSEIANTLYEKLDLGIQCISMVLFYFGSCKLLEKRFDM